MEMTSFLTWSASTPIKKIPPRSFAKDDTILGILPLISSTSSLYSTRTPSGHSLQNDSISSNAISFIGLVNIGIKSVLLYIIFVEILFSKYPHF